MPIKKIITWTQTEDTAVEEEVLLKMMHTLNKSARIPFEIFPNQSIMKNKITLMEWDGTLVNKNYAFLIEAKHKMTIVSIFDNVIDRVGRAILIEFFYF